MRETWNRTGTINRRTGMRSRSPIVRAVLAGASLLVAASLTACGPSGPEPSATPSTTGSPSVSSSPSSLRDRLASALQATSPTRAKLVTDPQTTLTPVAADWLPGWQILDVLNKTPPHPRRFYVALSTDGRAEVLTGKPEAFSTVLVDAGVQVDSAEQAVDVGSVFLDATRDFRAYAYRIDSVADIEWIPKPTAAEQPARDQLMKTYRSKVKPPQAAESGDGWQVTVWMVQGRDLVLHKLDIASGTAISDQAETARRTSPSRTLPRHSSALVGAAATVDAGCRTRSLPDPPAPRKPSSLV